MQRNNGIKKPSHKPKDLLKRFLQDELGGRDGSRNDQEYKKYGGIMNAIRHYSKRSDSLYIVSHRSVIQSMLDIADHSR